MPELGNKNNNIYTTLSMSELLRQTALKASNENRLKVGLDNCLTWLNTNGPLNVFAVALSSQLSDDILSETIIETYCYENKIPYLKIDSAILRRILNQMQSKQIRRANDLRCMLIMMPNDWMDSELELLKLIQESESKNETLVIFNHNKNLREIT